MTIDIQPSSYYDQVSHPKENKKIFLNISRKLKILFHTHKKGNGGKIPIFTPTMDQFQDFKLFMTSIEEYGKLSGIVKVIPPKEW